MSKLFSFLADMANSIIEVERTGKSVQSIDLNSSSYEWLKKETSDAGIGQVDGSIWGISIDIDDKLADGESVLHF